MTSYGYPGQSNLKDASYWGKILFNLVIVLDADQKWLSNVSFNTFARDLLHTEHDSLLHTL